MKWLLIGNFIFACANLVRGESSEQLQLVIEKIDTVFKTAELVASENSLTYENLVGANINGCDLRLEQTCFDPSSAFQALTQYIIFSQISLQSSFLFVSLNEQVSENIGGSAGGWGQDLAGSRYYFQKNVSGSTNCFFPTESQNPATVNFNAPTSNLRCDSNSDRYSTDSISSSSSETWSSVSAYNVTGEDNSWKIDMFANYGVYNQQTDAITSVDIDLEMIDSFMKSLKIDHDVVLIFVVEASSGTLIALSTPSVQSHSRESYTLNLNGLMLAKDAPVPLITPALESLESVGNLASGEASRSTTLTFNSSKYVVHGERLEMHTGVTWTVVEVTNADLSDECKCNDDSSEIEECECYINSVRRGELVAEEIDGILSAVQTTALMSSTCFNVLSQSPSLSNASFDILTRFVLFSQIGSQIDFAFVNLNTQPAPGIWGISGWAADLGSQYYFDTDADALTKCWYATPNTLIFSDPADINFTYNHIDEPYIQSSLTSESSESWSQVYPWSVYYADGSTQVHLFASYGIYNSITDTISSVDLDLLMLNDFVQKIGQDLSLKSTQSVVFVVEALTGVLVAISDIDTAINDGFNLFMATNTSNNPIVAAATSGYGNHLTDGIAEKSFTVTVSDTAYDVYTLRLQQYTGLDWIVFQAIELTAGTTTHTSTIPSTTSATIKDGVNSASYATLLSVSSIINGVCILMAVT